MIKAKWTKRTQKFLEILFLQKSPLYSARDGRWLIEFFAKLCEIISRPHLGVQGFGEYHGKSINCSRHYPLSFWCGSRGIHRHSRRTFFGRHNWGNLPPYRRCSWNLCPDLERLGRRRNASRSAFLYMHMGIFDPNMSITT